MPSYAEFRETVRKVHRGLIRETIKKVGYQTFEDKRGVPVIQVMPGNNEKFDFETHNFEAVIDTRTREMYNLQYKGELISANRVAANPNRIRDIAQDAYDAWYAVFGEDEYLPDHPGKPPFSVEGFSHTIDSLVSRWEILCADPQVQDLVCAIQNKNYEIAMRFLGAGDPHQVHNPAA